MRFLVILFKLIGLRFLYKRTQELWSSFFILLHSKRKIIINEIHYSISELDLLGSRYGTDKVSPNASRIDFDWSPHDYAWFYDLILSAKKGSVKNILECGIGTRSSALPSSMGPRGIPGASLKMWRDYFPEAVVIGIDIDVNVLFTDNNIVTFRVDQTNRDSIKKFLSELNSVYFDLVIDDGLHTFEAGVVLFEELWNRVAENGLYLIEDIEQKNIRKYVKYFHSAKISMSVVRFSSNYSWIDNNCLILIRKQ